MKRLTTFEFIAKAKEKHGDKYDYSRIKHVYASDKVSIICSDHGVFEQQPNSHLQGYGCPDCGGTKKSTTENFIKRAKQVHKDKYDYDKVNYTNNRTKVGASIM